MGKYEIPEYRISLREVGRQRYSVHKVGNSEMAAKVFRSLADEADREHFMVLYLSGTSTPLGCEVAAIGGLHGCALRPADVFKGALLANASAVIIGHNHPSGSSDPSKADIEMTRQCVAAGRAIGIEVLDHAIVTKNSWSSLAATGLLEAP